MGEGDSSFLKGYALSQVEIITKLTKLKIILWNLLLKANFNQTWHKAYLGEGNSSLMQIRDHLNSQRGVCLFHLLLNVMWWTCNLSFAQMCLLNETVSQVSDVAHWPLVLVLFIPIYHWRWFEMLYEGLGHHKKGG